MSEVPTLRPLPGFDWMLVSWGGPRAEACSYCEAPLADGGVPLILWNEDGWCARFCDDCQRKWWGLESCDDLDPEDEELHDDPPTLGPCCICEAETGARTIVMLPVKGVIPGHGWGCVLCKLPMDGASAVVCDECAGDLESGTKQLRFACRGYPATDGRVPIETLTVPHEHDPGVEH